MAKTYKASKMTVEDMEALNEERPRVQDAFSKYKTRCVIDDKEQAEAVVEQLEFYQHPDAKMDYMTGKQLEAMQRLADEIRADWMEDD